MIHTQSHQESAINKPKNLIVNETSNKFQENSLIQNKSNNFERTITQTGVMNTHMNNSFLHTQQNIPTKKENKKLNISANLGQ